MLPFSKKGWMKSRMNLLNAKRQKAVTVVAVLSYFAFLLWLYWPALFVFFASDDWVLLNYLKDIPANEWWRYLSPITIWFYRPLQSLQYGLTWHAAGFNPVPYNAQIVVMYMAMVGLGWIFVRQLFGTGIATVSAILFGVTPLGADVILWKGNFNTLQNALITLAASIFLVKFLQTRRDRWFWLTVTAAILNWFTKESGVNLPIILSAVWLGCYLQQRWAAPADGCSQFSFKKFVSQGFHDLWVFGFLALAYVGLWKFFFENIEQRYIITYHFVGPFQAVKQLLRGTNYTLFNFVYSPLLLDNIPTLQSVLSQVFVVHGYAWPLLAIALGFRYRNVPVICGVLFAMAAQVPTFALANYYEGRYYYLAALGGTTFLAGILWPVFRRFVDHAAVRRSAVSQLAAGGALVFAMWVFAGNVLMFREQKIRISIESVQMEKVFKEIATAGRELPSHSGILIESVSDKFIYNGHLGAIEMVQMATGREDMIALTRKTEQYYNSAYARALWPNRYIIDLRNVTPMLRRMELSTSTIQQEQER